MALLEIKAPSRYIEVRRPDGSLLSRHVTIEDAIESAANAPAGVTYDIIPPRRTVKVFGSLPLPGGDTQAPTVPGSPQFVSKGATSITFSWAASTDNVGVDGYQVFRNGTPIATTTQTSYTDTGLTPSTQYTHTVAAYDAAGNNSGVSGQTPLVTTTNANAAPVWNVGTQALTTNQSYTLDLTTVCSDADSNPITFSQISGTLPTGITFNAVAKTVSGTPTVVQSPSVTFRASDGITTTDQAIVFEVLNADTTAPSVPTMNAATNVAGSSMTASCGAVTDPTVADARTSGGVQYTFQRATDAGFTAGVVTQPPQSGASVNLTGLSQSTQYFLRAKSRDAVGNESAYSSAVNATTLSTSNNVEPSVYPLELVSPRAAGTFPSADSGTPAINAGHRIFKAYPGLEYNIRAAVIGGSYPYTFSLANAPSGMTINSRTGVIVWPDPQANATPTITVTDSESTQISSPWTIVVSTSGFKFFATTGNDTTGDGSIGNPWQTLEKVRTGTLNQVVYFRAGTYTYNGSASPYGTGHLKAGFGPGRGGSTQWLAYPGESVTINHGYVAGSNAGVMFEWVQTDTNPTYLQDLTFSNVSNELLKMHGFGHYYTFRRCTFKDIWEPTEGDNPSGIMWTTGDVSVLRHYVAMQENTNFDLDHGATAGAYKFYAVKKLLIEDEECYDAGNPFDIKFSVPRFEIRNSWYHDTVYSSGGRSQLGIGGNQNGQTDGECSGEIRYCRVTGRASPLGTTNGEVIALNNFNRTDAVHVYRNTLVGMIRIESSGTDDGPFTFRDNVIINNNITYPDRITYDFAAAQANVVLGTGDDANITGAIGSGIVNEAGDLALIGASRTAYLGSKGHEIP